MGEQPRGFFAALGGQLHLAVAHVVAPFCRMDTTSIALQPPTDISTISIGLGALSPALPSISTGGRKPIHPKR